MAPDKRGRSQQPRGRGHTTPRAGPNWPAPGSRLSRKGGRGCCRPVGSTLGWGHQGCGQMAPRGLPAPSPAQAKHAPVAGGRWVVCGRLLELSSPGWARLGLRSTGVWVAAASARMRRGWSSLKCGSLLSLTPASLPRRAVARKLFLCLTRSHALPSPSFSCSALRPPWQGAPTVLVSRVFLSPLARFLAAMILVIWLAWTPPKPSLDGLTKGWGLIGWWPRGLRKRIWIEMGLSQDLRKAEM